MTRVTGVVSRQGTDQSDLLNATAEQLALPPRVLVACAIAESNLNELAERWGSWPDVSFGEWQQTVAFAPIGDQSNSTANIAYVRGILLDWQAALRIAAPQLARWWKAYGDGPEALGRYNWPARGLAGNPNRGNIERAWEASSQYLAPEEDPMTDYVDAGWAPSPNYQTGRGGSSITAIVLHGTAGPGAVGWFQNPASQVSAHYVVEQDGTVTQCVREQDTAWHAGVVTPNSRFYGGPNPNAFTIGIEHARDRTNTSPLTPTQLGSALALVAAIQARYGGGLALITHDEINVGRICPGPGFPLDAFLAPPAEEDDLSAEERAELEQFRQDKPYVDTLTEQILPSALGALEAAARTAQASRAKAAQTLAAKVLEQCTAVRDATDIRE